MQFSDLRVGPAPQLGLDAYVRRRKRLAKQLDYGNTLVVATHKIQQFSNDVDYPYRPHSDFWYLTGFAEPGSVLVLEGGSGATRLFLRPRKRDAEIWTGRRLGVERAVDALGVDHAHDVGEIGTRLPDILGDSAVHALTSHDPIVQRVVRRSTDHLVPEAKPERPGGPGKRPLPQGERTLHGREMVHEMRLVKEPAELAMLRKACDLGVDAHVRAAAAITEGGHEYQVEAAFAHHGRHEGSTGVGYPSICGCGENAAVLHYVTNLSRLRKGRMFLIDAGCEWGYYTSDITRTYPVGGHFSRTQLAVYELVLAAHKAALAQVKPGHPFRAPHEAAVETLTQGLVDLGHIEGSYEKAMKAKSYRSFFMHGTSHWLGLDVHDAGSPNGPDGKPRRLREGMVLTVEPGLYYNPDYAPCPAGTEGIGIRIEDDVAVTATGARNMTRRLPVDPDAVAALVRKR